MLSYDFEDDVISMIPHSVRCMWQGQRYTRIDSSATSLIYVSLICSEIITVSCDKTFRK